MSNSVQHETSLILESTWGVTPSTPNAVRYNLTANTLQINKGSIESNVIRGRQVFDVRHGNKQVGGSLDFELAYGSIDALLEAVFCGTWASNKLVPGVTRRSFSVLRNYTDITASGTGKPYHIFKGVELNTFSIKVAPEAFIEGSFGVIGRELVTSNTLPAGLTYTAAGTNKGIDSFNGTLTVDGVTVGNVSSIDITLENGMEPRFVVFTQGKMNRPKIGKTRVKGSITAYFDSSDLLDAFNSATKKSLAFALLDLAGNSLAFELPSILGTAASADASKDSDITVTFPFSAIYEDAAVSPTPPDSIRISRIAASFALFFFGGSVAVFGSTSFLFA